MPRKQGDIGEEPTKPYEVVVRCVNGHCGPPRGEGFKSAQNVADPVSIKANVTCAWGVRYTGAKYFLGPSSPVAPDVRRTVSDL